MNKKLQKIVSILISAMMVFCFSAIPVNAVETSNLDKDDEAIIREELTKFGVIGETQDNLINKLKRGEIWDSMSGEYANLKPQDIITNDNEYYSKTTYPDGSVKVTTIDVSHTPSTRSVTGGTWQSGSGWWSVTGAYVKENYAVFVAGFRADYSGNQYSPSTINRVYEYNIATVGATYSNPYLTISRKQATSTTPARAYLRFDVTLKDDIGAFTQYVYLYVIGTSATSDRS